MGRMEKLFVTLGAISGLIAVAAGAFGAHALEDRLGEQRLRTYQTGVLYHLIHSLALVAAGWAVGRFGGAAAAVAGWSFVAGVVLFSGSLYALALTGVRQLGMITPFGGVAFLVGWAALAYTAWR